MVERKFAETINAINKIVISRTPLDLTWRNSQQLIYNDNDDFIIKIQDLKNNPGKNISVESGIYTWKLFLQNSLFDEMHLFVHPVIAGSGQKLFSEIEAKSFLQLKNARIYQNGVMALQYEKKTI
jgi:dihydrofolate reductase